MANITLSGGKLYIKPKGESQYKYFGTTDSMSVQTEVEKKEHMNTEGAIPSVDAEVITKQSASLSWSSADMSVEMMAFAFRGVVSEALADTTKSYSDIKAPCVIPTNGYGASSVTITGLSEDEDFRFDKRSGMLEILKVDKVQDNTIEVNFTEAKATKNFYAFKNAKTEASLMFIGDPAIGGAFKYEFYKVNITQDGELALKGDEWLQVSFSGNVLKDESRPTGEQFFKITQLPSDEI